MQLVVFLCHINKMKLIRFTNSGCRLAHWLLSALLMASYDVIIISELLKPQTAARALRSATRLPLTQTSAEVSG